jgi:hypothetical protein
VAVAVAGGAPAGEVGLLAAATGAGETECGERECEARVSVSLAAGRFVPAIHADARPISIGRPGKAGVGAALAKWAAGSGPCRLHSEHPIVNAARGG